MKSKAYRHGDVILMPTKEVKGTEQEKPILALGEVTLECGCHKIDDKGSLYTCLRQYSEKGKQGIQTVKTNEWRQLDTTKTRFGYLQSALHGNTVRINRLMAKAFLENKNNYPEVHHINGIRTDNRLKNLRWGDQKQNAADRRLHGNQIVGSKSPNAKLSEDKVASIRARRKGGKTLQGLADEFKVSKKLILLVVQEKIWRHV